MAGMLELSGSQTIRRKGTLGVSEDHAQLELAQFLFDYVESYEELQVLACLGVGRELWWEPEDVVRDCEVEESATLLSALERLAAAGVLAKQGAGPTVKFQLHQDFRD